MIRTVFLSLALGLAASSQDETEKDPTATQAPAFMGRAFLYEIDFEAGREHGWLTEDADPAEVQAAIVESLRTRLVSTGRFVEAQARAEEDGRISVTFVGKLADPIEAFLKEGLADPGRYRYAFLATEANLSALELSLEDERARWSAWRAANRDLPAASFSSVEREAGGPAPAIRWVEWSSEGAEQDVERLPVAVLREPSFTVVRSDLERLAPRRREGEAPSMLLELKEEPLARFRAYLASGAESASQRVAVVVNGKLVQIQEYADSEAAEPQAIDGGYDIDRLRAKLFAFAGEPFPAPLRFLGFDKRPLDNVRTR